MAGINSVQKSILDGIGQTSLIQLGAIVPSGCARILLKVESENPTGSLKDRMALAMIEAAEGDGRLRAGGNVVEYTGGSTGVSLAMICCVKGYPLHIVTSDAFALEKRNHMQALGAELTIVQSVDGAMDEALTRAMIEAAARIQQEGGGFWTDQLNNADQLIAYRAMGEEIWRQSGGDIDAFVHGVGTAASLRGVAESLRAHKSSLLITAVEPAESAVLSGGRTGGHKIEGLGAGFVVPLWEPSLVDEIAPVSTEEATDMARRLAREEALYAGISTGANLVQAIKLAERLGPAATVVTIMADSGLKYSSGNIYRSV